MRLVEAIPELRECVSRARGRRERIALVPTMGAFHEGHLSLMRRARADCDFVVVSLFVNPSQFGAGEDLASYPRDRSRDAALAREQGVDALFAPSFEQIYPDGFSTTVEVAGVGDTLCGDPGRRGPAHFRGVATVVTKLLNALSLKRALDAAAAAVTAGASDVATVVEAAQRQLDAPGVEPDYVEVVSARDLKPLDRLEGEILIAVAARIGRARLIDNVVVNAGQGHLVEPAAAGRTSR